MTGSAGDWEEAAGDREGASDLLAIRARLEAALERAGRPAGSARLVAVSKMQPEARVRAVLGLGQRSFGENRVQEAQDRWRPLMAEREGREEPLDLHLVGPLQTNKARAALGLFGTIHTLDRLRLAEALARLAQERGACPDLLVQVNTGAEPQKAGALPDEAEGLARAARAMDLPVRGLMCIPPEGADPVPHFRALAAMAATLGLPWLSMGMSGDFEAAAMEGATHVRVGSAIFGARLAPGG